VSVNGIAVVAPDTADSDSGAAADAPKPPEDNPDPPADATEELAAAVAFVPNENVAPPALPPTAA
jgi:hypothetical protein